jgi:hypothetical protein
MSATADPRQLATASGRGMGIAPGAHPGPLEWPRVFGGATVWNHSRPFLEVLRSEYGHLDFATLRGTYGWCIKYDQLDKFNALGVSRLDEFLDLFETGSELPLPYLMHLSVNRSLRRLRRHFRSPPEFRPNWADHPWLDRLWGPEVFIGQRGTGFGPVHIDHVAVHVGFCQLQGEKRFLLFPPEDGPNLYRYRGAQFPWQLRNSKIRGFDAATLERFPLLKRTHPVSLVLRAGECLFLPANWWHTTLNLADSVSYSIRIVNHTNALRTLGEHARGIPRALGRLRRRASPQGR